MNELEKLWGRPAWAYVTCRIYGRRQQWCLACTTQTTPARLRDEFARWLPGVELLAVRFTPPPHKASVAFPEPAHADPGQRERNCPGNAVGIVSEE